MKGYWEINIWTPCFSKITNIDAVFPNSDFVWICYVFLKQYFRMLF